MKEEEGEGRAAERDNCCSNNNNNKRERRRNGNRAKLEGIRKRKKKKARVEASYPFSFFAVGNSLSLFLLEEEGEEDGRK